MAAWNPRANELFLNALELTSPGDVGEYLAKACGDDRGLRQAVETLLQAHAAAGSFLGKHADVDRSTAMPATASPHEDAGTIIGNYKLLQLIGEGGFGSVFMADQERPVRRRVAVKIIKLGMDTKQVIARFEAERQALAVMDHPHIAKILDAGATEAGRPYFVMELVRGVPITEYCDTQNLSTRERLELFIPVCMAVQHAHQKGIIHRDIKPNNVLVTVADGKPVPKVIDFGIAKATNARLTERTYFTEYRQLIGTPQYMSPEQAEMTGVDIDTRSDIYSLGVLLYELLTGTTPFDAQELRGLAYDQMQRTIREVEPPRPSIRLSGLGKSAETIAQHRKTEPGKLGQLLRGELDWIVMRALEKDRTRRYDTPGTLAADVQRQMDNEPVLARPPSKLYRARKFMSKHRVGVLACAAVLAALVSGLALATVGFMRASSARDIAEKARVDAQGERNIAERARTEAQAQREIADAQKQLAVGNARKSELRLADGLISQADALSMANRFGEAHQHYLEAYDKFAELKEPLTAAAAGLWKSYRQASFPLLSFPAQPEVTSIAIAPNGRSALSGGWNALTLWDLPTGRELRTFTTHSESVLCVAIAPDGQTALAGSAKMLTLWDLAGGKAIRAFTGHTADVLCVAFAPDGRTAVSGSIDKALRVWDVSTGESLRTLTGHTNTVTSVEISPDGRTALSRSTDMTTKLWDLASGDVLQSLADSDVAAGSAGARDSHVASNRDVEKFGDFTRAKEVRSAIGLAAGMGEVAIAGDRGTALSTEGNTLKVWDLAAARNARPLTAPHTGILCAAITPDGRTVLSGNSDKTLRLWDLATGRTLRTFTGHMAHINRVAIAPDGRTALSAGADQTLKLWNLDTGEIVRTLTGHTGQVTCVAIAPDGRTALSGSMDKMVKLWDLVGGSCLQTFSGHSAQVNDVAFAPDGRTALSCSWDGTIKQWDVPGGKLLHDFRGDSAGVTSVIFAPDGTTALSGGADKAMKLWDLATGKVIRTFTGHTAQVWSVAITPDGRNAYSAAADTTLRLWDLATGHELRTFGGRSEGLIGVAISPDGQTVVSTSDHETLNLWDFARGPDQRAFESRVADAQAALRQNPGDAAALATMGEWYAFRGMDAWAVELLVRARGGGAAVAPVTLARCYWNLGQLPDARREFQAALDQSKDPAEQRYLGWCIKATGEN